MKAEVLQGDVMIRLADLQDGSVHCVVTSPPYWGLRDYGANGQLGLEPTPEEYVTNMVKVFQQVKRVLRRDGTLWLNLGDTYSSSGAKGSGSMTGKQSTNAGSYFKDIAENGRSTPGLEPKQLVGVPWRVAFALQADGWYLRSDIIWDKPNPMPESVTDRPTKSHEYVFLLTKSKHYFFDQEAVREKSVSAAGTAGTWDGNRDFGLPNGETRFAKPNLGGSIHGFRNIRSVWRIATQPFSEAHFATFPEALVRRCLLAGTSTKGVCAECGSPWQRVLDIKPMEIDRSERTHELGHTRSSGTMTQPRESRTVGWEATCKCVAGTVAPTVLDPFCGSGTTGIVANQLGCDFIGIELNPQYQQMAERRLDGSNEQHTLYEVLP